MKKIQLLLFIFAFSAMLNAQDKNVMQRTIDQAKNDLLEILSMPDNDFNFGVNLDLLKNAQGSYSIPVKRVDFDQFLNYTIDSLNYDISQLTSDMGKWVVPLSNENQVVATVTLAKDEKSGYRITELVNQQYQSELNALPEASRKNASIISVPNLRAVLYQSEGKIYTSYNGRNLRVPQDSVTFLQELQRDAIEFHAKYGDIIKKQRLVD